jgi:hypothetical protein
MKPAPPVIRIFFPLSATIGQSIRAQGAACGAASGRAGFARAPV